MADATTAATPTIPDEDSAARLSPKVRRLLRRHGLQATDVVTDDADGRVTPADVERAARQTPAGDGTRLRPPARTHGRPPRAGTTVASPLVRRLLRDGGLGPGDVTGTGPGGRVTRQDARRALDAATEHATVTAPPQPPMPAATTRRSPGEQHGRVQTVQLSRTRRTIAERMHQSLQTTAQLTAVVTVDMTRAMTARARLKPIVQRRTGVALTPLAPTARAVCNVLTRHPALNAAIDLEAGTATYHRDVHLGIAVDTPDGLVVPTVRSAQDLTVTALAARIADLARRARAGELSPDEVTGGTFTITNTGSRGVVLDTPILNPPQVGILATTLIEKRPVVVTDELGGDTLAIRQMSNLCLTYDHRLVDGADAARFLADLKHQLETVDLLAGVG